jgi:Flp pilus assembly protein TadG
MRKMAARPHVSAARGSALVELAIALPVLLLVFFGTVDFARVIYVGNALTNAARAGAQYGSVSKTNASASNIPAIKATAEAAFPTAQTITAIVSSPDCFCETDAAVATMVACLPTPTCPGGQHVTIYVTVTTSATFSRVTPFPGIPATIALTRTARMRVAD